MARRLIGTATTNSQGIATITYTGEGAGKLQLVAESGDLSSETYELIDAIFYDQAVTGAKNTNWYAPTGIGVSTSSNGTELTNSGTSTLHDWANNYTPITGAFTIEFDLLAYTDTTATGIRITGTNSNFMFQDKSCPQECHIKIVYDGNNLQYQIDDGALTTYATGITDTSLYVGFRFVGACSISYKNFVIY